MKTTRLFSLIVTALIGVIVPAWAGPHGGGFAGGGHFGGYSGGIRATPTFSGAGVRFSGNRNFGGLSRAPQQFSYYSGARTLAVAPPASARQLPERSISPKTGRAVAVNRQSNRVDSTVGQKRVSDSRLSTAANRQSSMKDHAFARHDANWHRDWDKRRAHFHHGHVFVFIDGFWWGLYPWDYYPYDASDYYPYDYNDYDYYPYGYDDQSAYGDSDQYGSSSTVSAVQSALAKLAYYQGAIDGVDGDETQAALARYQEDHDLSVTGTLTATTLQALGLQPVASN
jgi:Putative peptidoglycan binding domain